MVSFIKLGKKNNDKYAERHWLLFIGTKIIRLINFCIKKKTNKSESKSDINNTNSFYCNKASKINQSNTFEQITNHYLNRIFIYI